MRKVVKTTAKAAALAGLAIATGVGLAAGVTGNESYYSTGNGSSNITGGNLIVKAGDSEPGNLQVGADSAKNILVQTDVFTVPGLDIINMGTGDDHLAFGSENGFITFESTFGGSDNDDSIYYDNGTGATDDLLGIQSDDVLIRANNGDVVVQLGS